MCAEQRGELETLRAMERAARVAVENAAASMGRSSAATPLQTPLRAATDNSGGAFGAALQMSCISSLPEEGTWDVMGRHRTDVVSYASPDTRRSPLPTASTEHSRGACLLDQQAPADYSEACWQEPEQLLA